MSYVRKGFLICNRCGKRAEVNPPIDDPFLPTFKREECAAIAGWRKLDESHHLCPEFAAAYERRRAQAEAELRELAGMETVTIGI